MLFLDPRSVTLAGAPLHAVASITVERITARAALEWTDLGPHPAFADAPRQRTIITITRTLAADDHLDPRPGDIAALSFRAAPTDSAPGARRYTASLALLSVTHAHNAPDGREPVQRIRALALSADGAQDPLTIQHTHSEA